MGLEAPEYKVIREKKGKYNIVRFENMIEIDLYSVKEIQQTFDAGNKEGDEDWAIDLSPIVHMDSSGLGALARQGMFLAKKTKKIFILRPNERVMHLLSMPGFDKLLTIVENESKLP